MPLATFLHKHSLNAVTGLLFLLASWRLWWQPELPAVLAFIFGGVLLTVIDWRYHRLPTRLVYLTLLGVLVGLGAASLIQWDWHPLATAAVGAFLYAGAMCALWYGCATIGFRPFGYGDVRLALVLGLLLGWFGLHAVYIGALAGVSAAAAIGIVLAVKHRKLHMDMAFGPPLMIGALAVVLLHA
jgi:leader peptidase (prepilin peptidase)/N-methyltransferase